MFHFVRANMTTGNVRLLPLPQERKSSGGRALVSQVLYSEMAPGADPLSAGNVLVLAAGLFAGLPLSCFDEVVLGAKSPTSGQLASVRFMSRAARMMAAMNLRFVVVEGLPAEGREFVLLLEAGRASLLPLEECTTLPSGSGGFALHRALQECFGRNICTITAGHPAFSSSPLAALQVSGSSDGVIKVVPAHGMTGVMMSKGLRAIVFRGNDAMNGADRTGVSGKALLRETAQLLRCARQDSALDSTPYGRSSLCRLCLENQYAENDGSWEAACADFGLLPQAVREALPAIEVVEPVGRADALHTLAGRSVQPLMFSPLKAMLPPAPLLAAYDSIGLCPLAPQADTDGRVLNLLAALAESSCGGSWSAEHIIHAGTDTLNREQAFNNWARSSRD